MNTTLIILIIYLTGVFLTVGLVNAMQNDSNLTFFSGDVLGSIGIPLFSWLSIVAYTIAYITDTDGGFNHVWFKFSRLGRTWRDTVRLYKKLLLYLAAILIPFIAILAIYGWSIIIFDISTAISEQELFLQVFAAIYAAIIYGLAVFGICSLAHKLIKHTWMCANDLTW